MKHAITSLCAAFFALAIAGPTSTLAMDRPVLSVGDELVWDITSKGRSGVKKRRLTTRVVEVGEDTYAYEAGACRFTKMHGGFILSLRVEGEECKGRSTRVFKLVEGQVWPLRPGGEFTYTYVKTDIKGKKTKDKLDCRVGKAVAVKVPLGEFETLPVVCDSRSLRRTYYIAPSLGTHVKFLGEPFKGSGYFKAELRSYRNVKE